MKNRQNLKKRVPGTLTLLTALLLVAFLAGCHSNIPVAENHRAYPQTKLEATDHWRDIAVDVAERVKKALHDRKEDLLDRPIYVQGLNDQAFVQVFSELLKTELVSRGLLVSPERAPNSLVLEYEVQMVRFTEDRLGDGVLPAVGLAVADVFSGNRYTDPSSYEVIVTSKVINDNRFVIHTSTVAYINDGDRALYATDAAGTGGGGGKGGRTVRVIQR